MLRIWNVQDVRCSGCGMLIYKMHSETFQRGEIHFPQFIPDTAKSKSKLKRLFEKKERFIKVVNWRNLYKVAKFSLVIENHSEKTVKSITER